MDMFINQRMKSGVKVLEITHHIKNLNDKNNYYLEDKFFVPVVSLQL